MAVDRIRSGLVLLGVLVALVATEGYRAAARPGAEEFVPVAEPAAKAEAAAPSEHIGAVEIAEMLEAALSDEDQDYLLGAGWYERVGENLGIWVSVDRQRLYLLEGLRPVLDMVCATAEAGTGMVEHSMQTPLGWHAVAEKFGEDAPRGQVFRARAATAEIWQPGVRTSEDLVLTRVLWLTGLEPGRNQGVDGAGRTVDSKARYIYIHGTNEEERLGTPSSHGCIRLANDDVIEIFDRVPVGTPVLITEQGAG